MKAILCHRYDPPDSLSYEEVAVPVPADHEVLIRVRASSVNPADQTFRGKPYAVRIMTGLRKPKDPRMGRDLAGQVEAAGKNVTRFKPGDEVFGVAPGAFAEYACAKEEKVALKPANMTFEQAAAAPVAMITALQALRDKGQVQAGQRVLINGAAGGVGTFAVQIARWLGADVTGVCSARNVELVRSLGAGTVIDYTAEDFTRGSRHYDVVFDCVGSRWLPAVRRVLRPKGIYVPIGTKSMLHLLSVFGLRPFVSQRVTLFMASINPRDLDVLKELMETKQVTPVIDRRYALSEVPDALRYLAQGHARGKVIIAL